MDKQTSKPAAAADLPQANALAKLAKVEAKLADRQTCAQPAN